MTEARSHEYAVVDIETTGLFPRGGDRIIEIAVVRVGTAGNVAGTYSTLVNPQRDIGPTHIHGISAGDVVDAPTLGEIVGDIVAQLRDSVFVAHNAAFDRRFLQEELNQLGVGIPSIPTICTMRLARMADPSIPGRKLEVLCEHFGVPLKRAHSALDDATATAELFRSCMDKLDAWTSPDFSSLCIAPSRGGRGGWPGVEPCGKKLQRAAARKRRAQRSSYIARLVASLPAGGAGFSEATGYAGLLDRVLEDRRVERDEYSQLLELAAELGMSREQAETVHEAYLRGLMQIALMDGVVSSAEKRDLAEVAQILGIQPARANEMLEDARRSGVAAPDCEATGQARTCVAGKSVCFTGTFRCVIGGDRASRSAAEKAARKAGMVVKESVTKKLDCLVVADPDTMSSKARKARQYGVRLIAEPVFWRMVGMDFE